MSGFLGLTSFKNTSISVLLKTVETVEKYLKKKEKK